MLLSLFLSLDLLAQTTSSNCGVRVDLPHRFREHVPRFRGHGFNVNGTDDRDVYVEGVLATGGERLGSLIVYRMVRGERVEIGRANAHFLNGLPSQMVTRAIPIIQRACAQSFVGEDRELCPMNLPRIKEEKTFSRSADECDLITFSRTVVEECDNEGFDFCFTHINEYEEDRENWTHFRGRNCRVEVKGTNHFTHEESRLQRCEILNSCRQDISTNLLLNTEHRREQLQRYLEFYDCVSSDETAPQINQSERGASAEKAITPNTRTPPSARQD